MKATIEYKGHTFQVDLSQPIDLSIPLKNGIDNPSAWYVPAVKMEPVVMGDWVGEVKQGGSVNFFNITFNPHGHGTHTECVGHISQEKHSVNQCVQQFFFTAQVKSVTPQTKRRRSGHNFRKHQKRLERNRSYRYSNTTQ